MERLLGNRDHGLLGRPPRDPFSGADAPFGSPYGSPDVDFSDVFGGPPRGSSVCQARDGDRESPGAYASGGRGGGRRGVGEDAPAPRRPWSCSFGEKPVFGGVGSPAHRRQLDLGDDFFKDIFRGNDSAGSPPRKMDGDVFSPTPGSRVLSPARPLPPTSDVFRGGSSLPAQLSFSTGLVKGSSDPVFGSHAPDAVDKIEKSLPDVFSTSSPNAYAPAATTRLAQTKDEPKRNAHALFKKSPAPQAPHNHYRSSEAAKRSSNETNFTERQLKRDSSGSHLSSDSGYFHFSMYKWANIGVTLVMPYNLKERTKSQSNGCEISTQITQEADIRPANQSMPQGSRAFQVLSDLEYKNELDELAMTEDYVVSLTKEMKEVLSAAFDMTSTQSDIVDKSDDIHTCNKDDAEGSVGAEKPELKNLHHLFNGCSDREGDKEITREARKEEGLANDHTLKNLNDAIDTAKIEKTTGESMFSSRTGKAAKRTHDILANVEDKMVGSRVKGKVKEFIKIFNQEAAPRSGGIVENQARKPRVKNEVKGRILRPEDSESAHLVNADEDKTEKMGKEALSTPSMADQNLAKGAKEVSDRGSSMQKIDDSSSEVNNTSVLLSDSNLDSFAASSCTVEEAYIENIDESLVEELHENKNEVTEADAHREQIQMSDAKIREWSKGKEGNIRSLLSTLQYVIWPGSGWKPVPLVDIIEATSVRRAYQKALLCLHPDKLQQRGAEIHQKYVAEKVFGILQEAWDHFNSLSSL